MGVSILEGRDGRAAFYDDTTMTAFGPIFDDADVFASGHDHAQAFLDHLLQHEVEPRNLSGRLLENMASEWIKEMGAAARADERNTTPTLYCQSPLHRFRERNPDAPVKVRITGRHTDHRDGADVFVEAMSDGSRVRGKVIATHIKDAPSLHTVIEVRADWRTYAPPAVRAGR